MPGKGKPISVRKKRPIKPRDHVFWNGLRCEAVKVGKGTVTIRILDPTSGEKIEKEVPRSEVRALGK